jgi:type I restriction-modification system DNA methylase subunit
MTETSILDNIIQDLDYNSGALFDVADDYNLSEEDYLNKSGWLKAAKNAGAERLFFVDNNPVAVFASCARGKQTKIEAFNKLWCLARPRILFLASEGELSVIDLAQPPIRLKASGKKRNLKTLETLKTIKDVALELKDFHRDHLESGKIFEGKHFGSLKHRADKALISDLKTVRRELISEGLKDEYVKYAHALIGRSIFIRYLEDRKILTEEYFKKIAHPSPEWCKLLETSTLRDDFDVSKIYSFYARVLQDKNFTYALFRSLSRDFNGDMFPDIDEEEQAVQERHLNTVQDLFYGDAGIQKKLFFFSYKFDIIPLDLISAIYEEFYHSSSDDKEKNTKARQEGAYYTPPVLAEFVCSRVLTPHVLRKNPRILDPACGSGIFLVEAFRRIVRYRIKQNIEVPSFDELKQILGTQIVGIELSEEAAKITAFSLYLAMLHYLDPPSILQHIGQGNKLPKLIASAEQSDNHYNNIHIANSFELSNESIGDIDVIIGNPPWGAPGNKADAETKERHNVMLRWCKDNEFPIGNKESSQTFLWLTTKFLKKNGQCALLTSAGVLLKHGATSQAFRKKWMNKVCLTEVFNFTHVRKFFFKGAIAPFVLIHFNKAEQGETPVEYWSLKQVIAIKGAQAILLSKYDRAYLVRQDLTDNKTWKINWFGRHADSCLLLNLFTLKNLQSIVDIDKCARGFQEGNKKFPAKWLAKYKELPISCFTRYDSLSNSIKNPPPEKVEARGKTEDIYSGRRILFKRGVSTKLANHQLVVRYRDDKFCFRNSIHCIKLINQCDNKLYFLITGFLWSSFAKYYLFNISSNWGLWHDEIHLQELLEFPLPPKLTGRYANNVISIVKKLYNYKPYIKDIIHPDGIAEEEIKEQRRQWETELDEAVFDLYDFSDAERDLIRDFCEVTLPFFYKPYDSIGVIPAIAGNDISWIQNYAERFALRWEPYLNKDEVMRVDIHIGASGNMIAMEFYPANMGDPWDLRPKNDSWSYILEEIAKTLPRPMGTSQILLEGIVHAITDDAIIVIKRNEKRFWTRSLAREDADSTLYKAMKFEIDQSRGEQGLA